MDIIKKLKSFGIVFGIIALVLGIILTFKPVQTGIVLNTAVGVGVLIMGAVKLIQELLGRKEFERSMLYMVLPALMVILGIYILINQEVTMFTVGMIIAILAFILAADRFVTARSRRKNNLAYKGAFIEGIIHLLCGIFMCYNAISVTIAITIVTGIYLILVGIMIIVSSIYLKDL